jgi:hypothetical protein
MYRFIDLGDQIIDGVREFAFFDTVTDNFLDFCGSQTFDSIADFKSWAEGSGQDFERCLALIPDWVPVLTRWRDGDTIL